MKKIFLILVTGYFCIALSAQDYKGAAKYISTEQKLNDQYCTGLFQSTDGTILDLTQRNNAGSYLTILDWLEGRVAGLRIYESRGISIPVIRGGIASVYIDENPVSLNTLSAININDIAIVKIIKTPFYGGFNGTYGAIAIYTVDVEEDEDAAR